MRRDMLATLDSYERVPRILRLNVAGAPVDWATWQEAVCLYARDLVKWTYGDSVLRLLGGHSRIDGSRTRVDIHSIIACGGRRAAHPRSVPPLTNAALFGRDRGVCLYCGRLFPHASLTRDHVVPARAAGATSGTTWSQRASAATTTRAIACRTSAAWNCSRCPMSRTWPNTWR